MFKACSTDSKLMDDKDEHLLWEWFQIRQAEQIIIR